MGVRSCLVARAQGGPCHHHMLFWFDVTSPPGSHGLTFPPQRLSTTRVVATFAYSAASPPLRGIPNNHPTIRPEWRTVPPAGANRPAAPHTVRCYHLPLACYAGVLPGWTPGPLVTGRRAYRFVSYRFGHLPVWLPVLPPTVTTRRGRTGAASLDLQCVARLLPLPPPPRLPPRQTTRHLTTTARITDSAGSRRQPTTAATPANTAQRAGAAFRLRRALPPALWCRRLPVTRLPTCLRLPATFTATTTGARGRCSALPRPHTAADMATTLHPTLLARHETRCRTTPRLPTDSGGWVAVRLFANVPHCRPYSTTPHLLAEGRIRFGFYPPAWFYVPPQ